MASTGFALIVPLILIGLGNANNFVELNCNEKQVAQIGQDSLLECVVNTSKEVQDLQIQSVQWKRYSADSEPVIVLEYRDSRTNPIEGYSIAVPSWNNKNGNVSLLITKAAVEHVGHYECAVGTTSGNPEPIMISFNVTANYSKPTIELKTGKDSNNGEDILECSSTGYPEGQLRWFDVHNMEWTSAATTDSKRMKDGRIQLSSRLRFSVSNPSFTCAVFDETGNNVTYAIHNFEPTGSSSGLESTPAVQIVAPLVVIGSLLVGLLMTMLIYKVFRKRRYNGQFISQLDVEEGSHQYVKVSKPND